MATSELDNEKSANGSILGDLRARRQKVLSEATITFQVPRWTDPEIFVRYRAIDHTIISKCLRRIEQSKPADRGQVEVDANCDVLANGVVEVWGTTETTGDRKLSLDPDGVDKPLTAFDGRLALMLGLDERAAARQIIKNLFITDGDILTQAGSFIEFCGYQRDAADEVVEDL